MADIKVPEAANVQTSQGLVIGAAVTPTQIRRPWRSTARTIFQALIGLAAMAPLIYQAATEHNPEAATGWVALALAISGGVTRVMALPGIESFLQQYLSFLAAAPARNPEHRAENGSTVVEGALIVLAIVTTLWFLFWMLGYHPNGR